MEIRGKYNVGRIIVVFMGNCEKMEICVITNYVRQPKMNGFVERFNRSCNKIHHEHRDNIGNCSSYVEMLMQ